MCKIVCCDCGKSLGHNDCPCNETSHGYCEKCLKKAYEQLEEFERSQDDDKENSREWVF